MLARRWVDLRAEACEMVAEDVYRRLTMWIPPVITVVILCGAWPRRARGEGLPKG